MSAPSNEQFSNGTPLDLPKSGKRLGSNSSSDLANKGVLYFRRQLKMSVSAL